MLVAYDLKLKHYFAIFLESGYRLQRSNLQLWSSCGIDCILIVWVWNLSSQFTCGPVLLEGKVGIWWPHKGVWLAYSGYSMGSLGLGAAGQMGCAVAGGHHQHIPNYAAIVCLLLYCRTWDYKWSHLYFPICTCYYLRSILAKIHRKAKPKQRHCNSPIRHPS